MELTYETWVRKHLRRSFSSIGWILVIYYLIMNAAVFLTVFVEIIVKLMSGLASGEFPDILAVAEQASGNAWGYFLAAVIGILVLLLWKKRSFWRDEIWVKGKPMKTGSFFAILAVFLSGQLVYQFVTILLELLLNACGLTMVEGLNAMTGDMTSFSMFFYTGILAPIVEEILFRGLIQRTLLPYGKKFAIFCSAFTFGLFHGNLLQSPYAFLVGLVLGYVACEYSIGWAMVLHMVNNLVVADMLTRLTWGLPETTAAMLIWVIIAAFSLAAVIILIVKRRQISAYLQSDRIDPLCMKCFFSCAGIITLMVLMAMNMVIMCFMMITPM